MSLKFQTSKWDVEITWERLTLTPLENGSSSHHARALSEPGQAQKSEANYFLFDLLRQRLGLTHKQESLSK